ncbi:hypothetical protein [Daejeonella lutea]|nr:hypothetical protein [Daejeonella lutea]
MKNLDNLKAGDFVLYTSYKSTKDGTTHIYLLKWDFLENIKKLGGSFKWVNYGITVLSPPPPVIVPAKK